MLQINTPVGGFTFPNIASSGAVRTSSVSKFRLGYLETDAEIEQHNKLFNTGNFLVNGVTEFQEIENIKKRFPAKPSILDILEMQSEFISILESKLSELESQASDAQLDVLA